ncbi:DUF6183 family protein [Streptomyces sp. NBC_01390]|uniref:DUF6183 family protein n=1 Tax=Streptomyces sp. NBC_01390 TaxID=2903850 RepID=UPI003867D5F3
MSLAIGKPAQLSVREWRRSSVVALPLARAWRVLFAAASTGGAYNSGAYGAYGRLALSGRD